MLNDIGMGWGLLAGAEKTYNSVFLQSEGSVKVFGDKAKVNFGGDLSVAVGPVGRHADVKGSAGTGMYACYGAICLLFFSVELLECLDDHFVDVTAKYPIY